jgi:sarcosine oxidase subunit beta
MNGNPDVVVIGGGIIGCATASALAREGVRVTLIERADIAAGASGRNHGLIFYPQTEVTEDLYRRSHDLYREIAASSVVDVALDERPRGLMLVVAKESEWPEAGREAEASAGGGVAIDRLDSAGLHAAEPNLNPALLGGYFIDDGYLLDPAAMTLALAYDAVAHGAEVLTHVDVKQVVVEKGKVRGVAADKGVISAGTVVVAAGPWTSKLLRPLGVDLPIIGARGWLLLLRSMPKVTNHLIESSGWHLTHGDPGPPEVTVSGYASGREPEPAHVGLLVQQNRSGHVLLGGSRLSSMHEGPEGHEVTLEIARRAAETVPLLAGAPIAATWSGVRPMSPDGVPLIGWLKEVEGLFIATGHGGQGVMLGGGTGILAAQMIQSAPPFTDAARFDPSRKSEF